MCRRSKDGCGGASARHFCGGGPKEIGGRRRLAAKSAGRGFFGVETYTSLGCAGPAEEQSVDRDRRVAKALPRLPLVVKPRGSILVPSSGPEEDLQLARARSKTSAGRGKRTDLHVEPFPPAPERGPGPSGFWPRLWLVMTAGESTAWGKCLSSLRAQDRRRVLLVDAKCSENRRRPWPAWTPKDCVEIVATAPGRAGQSLRHSRGWHAAEKNLRQACEELFAHAARGA